MHTVSQDVVFVCGIFALCVSPSEAVLDREREKLQFKALCRFSMNDSFNLNLFQTTQCKVVFIKGLSVRLSLTAYFGFL